jgi:hypothetical protein
MSERLFDILLTTSELRAVESEKADFASCIISRNEQGFSGSQHFPPSQDVRRCDG